MDFRDESEVERLFIGRTTKEETILVWDGRKVVTTIRWNWLMERLLR